MIPNISIGQLLELGNNINIIDIRSIEKYNNNHIPEAINIPDNKLMLEPNKYLDKNKTYYIYCQKGIKSFKMCSYLNKLGYNTVNINGGYEGWLLKSYND